MDYSLNSKSKEKLITRVSDTRYEFPSNAAEVFIIDRRGRTVWRRQATGYGPIHWEGEDDRGGRVEAGDYVCKLLFMDGEVIYLPFVFSK